jgi:hypothetical protein
VSRPIPHQVRVPGYPGVTVLDGGDRAPTLVSTLGAFSRLDPFETDRYQRLAAAQHRRIAVVETPGWAKGTRLTPSARAELRLGEFGAIGAAMGESVVAAAGLDAGDEVSVLGYSLGCSTATAMTRWYAEHGLRVRHLTLVEPVALVPMKPTELLARNTWEGLFARRHLQENHHLTEIPAPSVVNLGAGQRLPEPLHLLWALSRGRLADTVCEAARAYPGLAVTLIRGGSSRLVDHRAVRTLAARLRELGATVDTRVVVGAHHALWHSRPTVGRLAEAIG